MLYSFLLYGPVWVCLVFVTWVIFDSDKHNRALWYFTAALFCLAYMIFSYVTYSGTHYDIYKTMDIIYAGVALAFVPLCAYYIDVLTFGRIKPWLYIIRFLPPVVMFVVVWAIYGWAGDQNTILFVRYYLCHEPIELPDTYVMHVLSYVSYYLFTAIMCIQYLTLSVTAPLKLVRYFKRLRDYYSNAEERHIQHRSILIISVSLVSVLAAVICLLPSARNPNNTIFSLMCLYFSAAIFFFGRAALLLKTPHPDFDKDSRSPLPDSCDSPTDDSRELYDRIVSLVQSENAYLQKSLCLDDIALRLGSNRSYISRAINQYGETSFVDFINRYRIEYAEQRMEDSPNLTLNAIAEVSGFSSYSSFYRAFIAVKGVSPKRHTGR